MTLTLEIVGPQAAALGDVSRKVFDAAGGTIGRLPDNTWSLPDPYVSSRHAVIRFRGGTFYIEDTSTNGVFVNSADNQLPKGQPYALKAGDWIFIEPYEIRVTIATAAPGLPAASPFDDLFAPAVPVPPPAGSASPALDDPFGIPVSAPRYAPEALPPPARAVTPPPNPYAGFDPLPAESVDPLDLLGLAPQRAPRQAPRAADLAGGSPLSAHYTPPVPMPAAPEPGRPSGGGPVIPHDYNPLGGDTSAGPPSAPAVSPKAASASRQPLRPSSGAPEAVPAGRIEAPNASHAPAAPPRGADGGLAAVLAGAGLEDVPVTPELARNFGRILRVVVGGVMDLLQARQRIKSEFRMGMTTFKPADNNPLKFSANVDDALHNLLVKRNAAYLGPVEAFEDAFDDVRSHQLAMLAGVRVAFETMLAEFDPDRLQEEFDRQVKKGALLSAPAKLRYWDQYRERIHDMVRDPEASFRELFGDEFAKAYEEQLRRLKAQGRAVKS